MFPRKSIKGMYVRKIQSTWRNMSVSRKNSVFAFLDRLVQQLLSFGLFVAAVAILGLEESGKLAFILGIFQLFTFISSVGLDLIVVRRLKEELEPNRVLINASIMLSSFGGLVAWALCMVVVWGGGVVAQELQLVGVCFFISYQMRAVFVCEFPYRAHLLINRYFWTKIISLMVGAIARLVLMLSGLGVIGFLFGSVIEIALYSGLLWMSAKKRFSLGLTKGDVKPICHAIRGIVCEAVPQMINSGLYVVQTRADIVILGYIAAPNFVALLNLISKFQELGVTVMSSIRTTWMSTLSYSFLVSEKGFITDYMKKAQLMAIIGGLFLFSAVCIGGLSVMIDGRGLGWFSFWSFVLYGLSLLFVYSTALRKVYVTIFKMQAQLAQLTIYLLIFKAVLVAALMPIFGVYAPVMSTVGAFAASAIIGDKVIGADSWVCSAHRDGLKGVFRYKAYLNFFSIICNSPRSRGPQAS